ncbi:hypothetical protein EV359DRAFT_82251 [Lentinula novae-zelandiae]|nr:hypothetical protein EV359DRAFT_82251 [Lentinula novae-zelandiae]
MLHDFIRDVPEEYNTIPGGNGSVGRQSDDDAGQVSGGGSNDLQLLLHSYETLPYELTSTLDPASRSLVNAVLRRWRATMSSRSSPKTTVMVEAGYRYDLERSMDESGEEGDFMTLARNQGILSGDDEDESSPRSPEFDIEISRALSPSRFSRALPPVPSAFSALSINTETRPRRPSSVSIPSSLHLVTMSPFDDAAIREQSKAPRQHRYSLQFETATPTGLNFADLQKQGLDLERAL